MQVRDIAVVGLGAIGRLLADTLARAERLGAVRFRDVGVLLARQASAHETGGPYQRQLDHFARVIAGQEKPIVDAAGAERADDELDLRGRDAEDASSRRGR